MGNARWQFFVCVGHVDAYVCTQSVSFKINSRRERLYVERERQRVRGRKGGSERERERELEKCYMQVANSSS